jgi:hypothetical protein
MSDRNRLTFSDHNVFGPHTRGLVVRIFMVALLGMLFWHTVTAAGTP